MSSTVQTTDGHLTIHSMKAGKVLKVDRAIKVNGTVVFVDDKGRLYCPKVGDGYYYTMSEWHFMEPLLYGLQKLGVITEKQRQEYLNEARRRDSIGDAKYALEQLDHLSEKYGLDLAEARRKIGAIANQPIVGEE